MKFLDYDRQNGEVLGFYDKEIHGGDIPPKCIIISDHVWNLYISNQGKYVVNINNQYDDGEITEFADVFIKRYIAPEVILSNAKTSRIDALNKSCEAAIESGFTSSATGTSHIYRFNKAEDQLNFNQQATIMQIMPDMTTIYWKTEDAGVIPHTREQFINVLIDASNNKQYNIQKYWTLKAKVNAATTVDEVKSINW